MSNLLAQWLKIISVALGCCLLATTGAIAEPTQTELLEKLESHSNTRQSQESSVADLEYVLLTDWPLEPPVAESEGFPYRLIKCGKV